MTAPEPVLAGERKPCGRVECTVPASVRMVGTAVRGELILARIPSTRPLPPLLMEPVDLCKGHAVEAVASTLVTWEA